MYTDNMRRAFHNILAPNFFSITIEDNEHFLVIRLDAKQFMSLTYEQKIESLEYVNRVKDALEQNGAIVLVVRNPINE